MPPKKRTIGSTPAERAKERERKRGDAADAAEKRAMASAIEEKRLAAEKEEKEFRKRIQQYPYDVRVEAWQFHQHYWSSPRAVTSCHVGR